jgi:hypothetical protein
MEKKELRAKFKKEILIARGLKKIDQKFTVRDYDNMMREKAQAEVLDSILPSFEDMYFNMQQA